MEDASFELNTQEAAVDDKHVEMANFPTVDLQPTDANMVNGEATNALDSAENQDKDNSDSCDNLVIDESRSEDAVYQHTNPYFSESIFELSNHYNLKPREGIPKVTLKKVNNKYFCSKKRPKKPKVLRDYGQFLGLQPAVQFKCSKCSSVGFETLHSLNEHLSVCTGTTISQPELVHNNSTNIKVTRKVFLCSACGTYYENWNLFLHMREVHKRFICLYCLGMFSHADKLSLHIVSKHNCAPNYYMNEEEFVSGYKDQACFLLCCDCQSVFNEKDNFVNHLCENATAAGGRVNSSDSSSTLLTNNCSVAVDKTNECSNSQQVHVSHHSSSNTANCSNDNVSVIEVCERPVADGVLSSNSRSSERIENGDNNLLMSDDSDRFQAALNQQGNNQSAPVKVFGDFGTEDFKDVNYPETNVPSEAEETSIEQQQQQQQEEVTTETEEETRKVPKVTLKLKLPFDSSNYPVEEANDESDEYHSEDSDKVTMEAEKIATEDDKPLETNEANDESNVVEEEKPKECETDKKDLNISLPTAGEDVPVIELELDQPLDKFDIKLLIQKCLRATIATCLYCNHARKISVNGKQLAMHAIAEHRYAATVKSITAEELIPESFNARFKDCFETLDSMYFDLEDNEGGVTFSHVFECFQCRYSTGVHKELYVHNRKMHTKALLLCIMCKTSFYSYSELVCHLCPGVYSHGKDVQFRCCLCVSDALPSAFRLMVHLRKKHHVCDVCMEMCQNQPRLSNHVWKHKLHHLCYRCGIAYRNKPDITKHLYWKHGTESVECSRCLMKKWPHVYHFCMPPANFNCDECCLSFTRASHLKVHKRLHSEEFPYICTEENCTERFISKRLQEKHVRRHTHPDEPLQVADDGPVVDVQDNTEAATVANTNEVPALEAAQNDAENPTSEEKVEVEEEKPVKPKVDVYDLPELNLSESDSSDSEDEANITVKTRPPTPLETELCDIQVLESVDSIISNEDLMQKASPEEISGVVNASEVPEVEESDVPILENVWDDFKNYQANIAKTILTDLGGQSESLPEILTDIPAELTLEEVLRDHDYCPPTTDTLKEQEGIPDNICKENSADHDYCNGNGKSANVQPSKGVVANDAPKAKGASSSSDSDSSSCTCGSNCSCSSSSDSSSSSSDSSESDSSSEEGRRRQQLRREKRRIKKVKKHSESQSIDVVNDRNQNGAADAKPGEIIMRDSDLETTETDTDEEFYDKEPQKLANKLIAEKREKLLQMAGIGPYINGSMIDSRPSTPSLPEAEVKAKSSKKKSKSKKKKKKKSRLRTKSTNNGRNGGGSIALSNIQPTVAPLTLSLPKKPSPIYYTTPNNHVVNNAATNSMQVQQTTTPVSADSSDPNATPTNSNTRSSKRRRVPNKFYGYSSDEDNNVMKMLGATTPVVKFRKADLPAPKPKLFVPPLTIKTSSPTVGPISIKMNPKNNSMRVQPLRLPIPPKQKRNRTSKGRAKKRAALSVNSQSNPTMLQHDMDSASDSNSSGSSDNSGEGALQIALPKGRMPPKPPHPSNDPNKKQALYCYCRCPYDEVSEMIGCDAEDCAIEWFHFECVNIMVPPKGQWFCPDCRKKKYEKRQELMAAQKLKQMQQQQQQQAIS